MELKTIKPSDYLNIYFLQNESHPKHLRESMVVLTSKIYVSPESCFCMNEDDDCMAYIIALPFPLNKTPSLKFPVLKFDEHETMLIHDCVVKRFMRGKGVAKDLFHKVKEYASEEKYKRLALVAVEGTYSYWERYGFEVTNVPVDPGYGEDAVYMVRNL